MKENVKKLLSLLLCLAMAIGLLPMAALAEGTETDVSTIANAAYILETQKDTLLSDAKYEYHANTDGEKISICSNDGKTVYVLADGIEKKINFTHTKGESDATYSWALSSTSGSPFSLQNDENAHDKTLIISAKAKNGDNININSYLARGHEYVSIKVVDAATFAKMRYANLYPNAQVTMAVLENSSISAAGYDNKNLSSLVRLSPEGATYQFYNSTPAKSTNAKNVNFAENAYSYFGEDFFNSTFITGSDASTSSSKEHALIGLADTNGVMNTSENSLQAYVSTTARTEIIMSEKNCTEAQASGYELIPYVIKYMAKDARWHIDCMIVEKTETITYNTSVGGTVSPASEQIAAATGTPSGSTATPAAGYHFVNWTDATGNEVSTAANFVPTTTETATYTANFAADSNVTVTYNIVGGKWTDGTTTKTVALTKDAEGNATLKASDLPSYTATDKNNTVATWSSSTAGISVPTATTNITLSNDVTFTLTLTASTSGGNGGSGSGGTSGGGTSGGGTSGGGTSGGGSTGGGTTIDEPSTPLSSTPTLNKADHFGYIVGYADGTVNPNGNITRAEVATIFYRLLSDESRKAYFKQTNSFSDVSSGDWFNNAVSTLSNAGVINGYTDGSFKPNGQITRAEFATIATRFYDAATKTYDSDPYTDVATSWARQYIDHAAELGIIHGYDDGTFKPDNNITRAEAITLVNNVLGRTPDKDHLLAGMMTWSDNADTSAWYYAAIQEATNSHDFTKGEGESYETWTKLNAAKDWAALETEWSKG